MGAEKRGALIVLEGLDRSGKSSQCQRLVDFLKGIGLAAEAWRFPDRATAIGSSISAYLAGGSELDDRAVHLLFSANRWEKRQQMEKQLMAGTTLVVDRYSYSGVAFSAAKGLDMEWCKAPEIGLPAADLVLYLDISPEEAAKRGGYGVERYEQLDFQRKVASQYKNLQDKRWKIVDARQSFDQVHELMRETCVKTVSLCLNGYHLSRLWTGLLMALVYHFDAIARAGRLEATFLLHDIEHDTSFTIDSSFDANLPEGPWEFTIMAAAGDLCCVRGRHPTQQDVLMLCSPHQHAWKRLPLCNTVRRFKRVGMYFHKDADDYSYKVLVIELDGETMVTEVFDSKLDAWSTLVQQEKKFHKLLGRCEFIHDAQEFYHLVVKEVLHADDQFTSTENVYSTIRYRTSLGGWQIVDINLPERMIDDCNDGCSSAYRRVTNASFVGSGNCLKLLVETESWSAEFTRDFEQNDTLVYEYDQASGK